MLWTELELDRTFPDERLRQAWAAAFGIAPHAVAVIEDGTEVDPWADTRIQIVLKRQPQQGDFPLHVMVILGKSALDAKVADPAAELAMVRRLCAELDCRALMGTYDLNLYEWLLVDPAGDAILVHVDPDRLDENDALVVSRTISTPDALVALGTPMNRALTASG